jgi:hypothetical protein
MAARLRAQTHLWDTGRRIVARPRVVVGVPIPGERLDIERRDGLG